jgi:hypothetical protein
MISHNTMNAKTLGLILASLGMAVASPLAAENPPAKDGVIALRASWVTGRRSVHRVSAATDQKLTVPGVREPMKQQITQQLEYAVRVGPDLPGGGQELGIEFQRLQVLSLLGTQTVLDFDSAKDAKEDGGNPAAAMLRPLVGAKLKVLTTPSGKLDKVEGQDQLREQMLKNAPAMMAGMMQGMFGENLVEQIGLLPQYLPAKPVAVESEWPLRIELSGGPLGKITLNGTTRFAKWERRQDRDCVVLEGKGRIWSLPKPGVPSMGSISGDFRSTTWFDPRDGLQIESVSTQTLTARIKAMGQEMTIPSTQLATNVLVTIEAPAKK